MASERIHIYELLEPLARGGPGHAHRARVAEAGGPAEPGAPVVVRTADLADVEDKLLLVRLEVTHAAAARIAGPAVAAPLDHGLVDGQEPRFWSASHWIAGRTLADLLGSTAIVPDLLLEAIVGRVAEGLAAVHAAGVVGIGLSPDSILLGDDGEATIVDPGFGPAIGVRWPGTGRPPASMMCASPEVLGGSAADLRSDLFSLGCILFRCMTGGWHRPEDARALRASAHQMDAARPDCERTQCSLFLSEVAYALLRSDPDDRIASAGALVAILRDRRGGAWWQALGAVEADPGRASFRLDAACEIGADDGDDAGAGVAGATLSLAAGPQAARPLDVAEAVPLPRAAVPPAPETPPAPIPQPAPRPAGAWWDARRTPPPPVVPHTARCAGRDAEVQALVDAAARLGSDECNPAAGARVILVSGDAGSGKTRVLDAVIERIGALPAAVRPFVLRGEHRSAGIGRPLGAFTEALTSWIHDHRIVSAADVAPLLGDSPAIATTFAALLSSEAPPAGAPPLPRTSVPAAYLRCLRTIAGRAPVVLVIENLQWADPEVLDLFASTARAAQDLPLLLIGTHRPPADGDELAATVAALRRLSHFSSVHLGPLSPAPFAQIAAEVVSPPAAGSDLAARVHAASRGLPGALVETLAALEAEGALTRQPDGRLAPSDRLAGAALPTDALDAARRRIAALAADDCALISVACVQGVAFDAEVAAIAAGLDPARASSAIARLQTAGVVLRHGAALRFASESLFEATLCLPDGGSPAARHATTAAAFLASRNPGQLPPAAIHGVLSYRVAWHYLMSGRPSLGLPYVSAATSHLRGTCRHGDGERLTALACRAIAADPAHAGDLADLLLERSRFLGQQGRDVEQHAALEEALLRARERRDLVRESRLLLDLALSAATLEQPGRSDNCAKQALACAHRAGETEVELRAHMHFAQTAFRQGRLQDARSNYASAREIATRRGDEAAAAEIHQGIGLVAQASGATDQAEAAFRAALQSHRARQNLAGEAETLACLGHLAAGAGDLVRAERSLRRALAIHVALGDGNGETRVLGLLAMVLQESGCLVEAREAHGACLARARRLESRAGEVVALLNVATVDGFLGRIDEARASYGEALCGAKALADARLQGYALTGLGEVARQCGNLKVARDLVDRAAVQFRGSQDPSGLAAALLASGRIETFAGDGKRAKAQLFEARHLAEQQNARQVLALADALLGLLAARAGDPDAAERRAVQAGLELTDLGASDVARVEILFLHAIMLRVLGRPAEADRKLFHAEAILLESVRTLPDDDCEHVLTRLTPNREILAGTAAARAAAPHRAPDPADTVGIEAGV